MCTDEDVVEPIDDEVDGGDGCAIGACVSAMTDAEGSGGTDGAAVRRGGARLGGGEVRSGACAAASTARGS